MEGRVVDGQDLRPAAGQAPARPRREEDHPVPVAPEARPPSQPHVSTVPDRRGDRLGLPAMAGHDLIRSQDGGGAAWPGHRGRPALPSCPVPTAHRPVRVDARLAGGGASATAGCARAEWPRQQRVPVIPPDRVQENRPPADRSGRGRWSAGCRMARMGNRQRHRGSRGRHARKEPRPSFLRRRRRISSLPGHRPPRQAVPAGCSTKVSPRRGGRSHR